MRTRISILAAALGAIAVACGGGSDVAATVNGQAISYDEVVELIVTDSETIDANVFAETLTRLIVDEAIVQQSAADFGIERTADEIATQRAELLDPLLAQGLTLEQILEGNNITDAAVDAVAAQAVLQTKLVDALVADIPDPSEEDLRARFDAVGPTLATVCSAHILLENEADAQAALDRALGGEDFGELAIELSTGPSGPTGGDLGCSAPAGFVQEFATATLEAELNTPVGPVETQFGFHVILVTERVSSFDELRQDVVDDLNAAETQERFDGWLTAVVNDADIVVEAEYGTWTIDPTPTVIPPSA